MPCPVLGESESVCMWLCPHHVRRSAADATAARGPSRRVVYLHPDLPHAKLRWANTLKYVSVSYKTQVYYYYYYYYLLFIADSSRRAGTNLSTVPTSN
jgi:hypothetical protein